MAINATASDLQRLLDLQTEDTAIKRLTERKSSLPEAQQLQTLNEQIAELTSDIEIATRQNTDVGRDQDKLEGEIEIAEAKIAKEEQRMFSGSVANPKELSALQAEVEMLKRKKGELEDQLLEVMVAKENAAATLERLEGERSRASSEAERLTNEVAMLVNDIEAQLADHEARRGEIARDIPDDVLKLYEQIRGSKGGIGAAALEGGTCQGCHTKLPNKEVERLKAEGGLQRCENCRRILVVVS
ncbi:MAG: C4-type zinc ribbon domain-containing protein [Actinomycetota bacterium]|nr:C4-type zinc ribbon domain-containing protein [Actinomycetota bacterium]